MIFLGYTRPSDARPPYYYAGEEQVYCERPVLIRTKRAVFHLPSLALDRVSVWLVQDRDSLNAIIELFLTESYQAPITVAGWAVVWFDMMTASEDPAFSGPLEWMRTGKIPRHPKPDWQER